MTRKIRKKNIAYTNSEQMHASHILALSMLRAFWHYMLFPL